MKKLLIKLLEPLDRFVFNYMVRAGLIKSFIPELLSFGTAVFASKGSKGSKNEVPERLTMDELVDNYAAIMAGEGARGQFEGIYDPALTDLALTISADAGMRLSADQLKVLNQYIDGIPGGPNPRKQRAEERLAGLIAKQAAGQTKVTEEDLRAEAQKLFPVSKSSFRKSGSQKRKDKANKEKQEVYIAANKNRIGQDVSQDIAQLRAEIQNMPDTVEEVKGLTKIKQEQAQVEGDIQRNQKAQTAEANLGLVQDNARAFTEAFRDADPASRDLAIQATERAGQGQTRIGQRGEELIGRGVRDASVEEQAIRDAGMRRINAPLAQAGVAEQAMLGSGLANIDAVSQPGVAEQGLLGIGQANANAALRQASQAEQRLNEVGMSLTDLTPTEQEAMIGSQAMKFLQSTGELSPLEKIRTTRAARQASIARGRGMDQSSIFNELLARVAEESDKQEDQIRLGMDLAKTQSGLRLDRFGEGRNFLTDADDLADSRRQEVLDRQQQSISAFTNAGTLAGNRAVTDLNRQKFGADALTQASNFEQRRIENQRADETLGANFLGQSAGLETGRIGEDLRATTLGANLLTQDENIQNQRLQSAFDMNRNLAADPMQTIIGQNPDTTGRAMQTVGAGAVQQGLQGLNFIDPNAVLNTVLANQQNATQAAAANAQIAEAKRANTLDFIGNMLPLMSSIGTTTPATTTTKTN